jgi:UDP-N-acetyl-2-amino-2-deoxyglucuronate dehydrogenase
MRIGLIGLGVAGRRHADACVKLPGVELVAAADPALPAESAARELGAAWYADYEPMLASERLDGVVVSLPHGLLSVAGIAVARRGLHLLLEKPMGNTLAEADAVLAAARAGGGALMVNFVHRFRAEYRSAKAAIERGAIGSPVMILDFMTSGASVLPPWVWQAEQSGGGMMMYNGVHSVDRLAWLAGSPIARATGLAGTFSYPVDLEDNLVGCVAFRGGLGAVIQHKSTATRTLGDWQTMIWGTRGAIKVLSGGGLEIASEKEQISLNVEDDDRFLGGLIEFTSAIAAGRAPCPDGRAGRAALAAVLGLYEAARTGRTVEIEEAEA